MWLVAPQNFAIEHARQKDVVGKLRLARALRARVDLAEWFADYFEWLPVVLVVAHESNIATKRHKKHKRYRVNESRNSIAALFALRFISVTFELFRGHFLFTTHKDFHVATPSLHHARAPRPTRWLRKSLYSQCSDRDYS